MQCPIFKGDVRCQAMFQTHQALGQHMVHTNDEFRGFKHYAKFITLTNQCVHCLSTFKRRETAQAHTANAEKLGLAAPADQNTIYKSFPLLR